MSTWTRDYRVTEIDDGQMYRWVVTGRDLDDPREWVEITRCPSRASAYAYVHAVTERQEAAQ